MFANALDARFRLFGRNRARWAGATPFKVWTYVGVAMFSDVKIKGRMSDCIRRWEWRRRRYFGNDAINQKKGEQEGKWATTNILLGVAIDTRSGEISIPVERIYGDKLLVECEDFDPGKATLSLKAVQTLRGLCQHWINASCFWRSPIQLFDALLGCADEVGRSIRYNDAEILEGRWNMMAFIRYMATRGDIWPCLFRNRLKKLMSLSKRLSGALVSQLHRFFAFLAKF